MHRRSVTRETALRRMQTKALLLCCMWAVALGRPTQSSTSDKPASRRSAAAGKNTGGATLAVLKKATGGKAPSSLSGFDTPSSGGYFNDDYQNAQGGGYQHAGASQFEDPGNNFGGGIIYSGVPSPGQYQHSSADPTFHGTPNAHNFGYAVEDSQLGNQHAHNGYSDGETTKGEYRVLLPDGRTQIVTYSADPKMGFMARVSYEGEAKPYVPSKKNQQIDAGQYQGGLAYY